MCPILEPYWYVCKLHGLLSSASRYHNDVPSLFRRRLKELSAPSLAKEDVSDSGDFAQFGQLIRPTKASLFDIIPVDGAQVKRGMFERLM